MKMSKPFIVGAALAAVATAGAVSLTDSSDSESATLSELEELFSDDEHEVDQPVLASNEF